MYQSILFCVAIAGKWELTELETDGALEGDVGLVMSVSCLTNCCDCTDHFVFYLFLHSKQPSTTPLLPSWIGLSLSKAQRLL